MRRETARRVQYARGYIELGLLAEASDELDAIEFADRFLPDVVSARIDYHIAAKHWQLAVGLSQDLARRHPEKEQGWISWAYALRELQLIAEAKAVLSEAEPIHGPTSATLHYNLACYHCLLGEMPEARVRLRKACQLHPEFKTAALEDPDLKALWGELTG